LEVEFSHKIEEIKKQTSRSSKDQDEKIDIFMERERNLAQVLNKTREEMLGLKTQNRDQSKRIDQLETKLSMLQNTPPTSKNSEDIMTESCDEQQISQNLRKRSKKRPARLLPLQILYNRNNTHPVIPQFYGPPHNCSELSKLGYTLNGFYQVKPFISNRSNVDDFTQLETIYCAFKQPGGVVDKTKMEKRVVPKSAKVKQLVGIPTSCKDLQQHGHSLNGLYLIKKSLPNNQGTKIQSAYCDFQTPTSTNGMLNLIFKKGTYEIFFTFVFLRNATIKKIQIKYSKVKT